jgi:hypothetical protein
MKVLAETQKYVLIQCPVDVCRAPAKSLSEGAKNMMEFYEKLESKGLIPVEYVRNVEGVMCKKTEDYLG